MRSKQPTALELFEQFKLRFQQVDVRPAGFKSYSNTDPGLCMEKLYLELYHHSRDEGLEGTIIQHDFFLDIRKVCFSLIFDPTGENVVQQLQAAVWAAALEESLKNVRFSVEAAWRGKVYSIYNYDMLHIRTSQALVLGLHLPKHILLHGSGWKAFIPQGPERQAIETAHALECAREDQTRSEAGQSIRELEDSLKQQLVAVGV